MAIRIMDDTMTLEIDNRVVASARFSKHATADGNGAWIIPAHHGGGRAQRADAPACERETPSQR